MITIANSSINFSLFLWAKNKIWYHIQSDVLWATFDSYFVEIAITYLGLPTFKQEQSPSQGGSIYFDVQKAVASLIEYQFSYSMELPVPEQTIITPNALYNFDISFTEYQNGVATSTINSSFKAILAGLDNDNFTYQLQNKWIFEDWKFLTSSPTKPASPDVPDFLRHFNTYNTVTNIDINVRLLYDDGTSNDFVAYTNYATDQKFYTIPTGYQALNIAINLLPNKTLRFFAVWVSKTGDKTYRLSEVMTYEMFSQPELEKKAFLFRNSLGAYETFFCTGQILEQIQSKKTALKKLYPSGVVGYQYTFDNDFVNEQNGKRTLTVATGWLSKDFAESLQEAAISQKVWLIDNDVVQGLTPVIIENISSVYYEKNNELIGYIFTASYAYDIDLYTKDIVRETYGLPLAPPQPLSAEGFWINESQGLNLRNTFINPSGIYNSAYTTVSIFFKNSMSFDTGFEWFAADYVIYLDPIADMRFRTYDSLNGFFAYYPLTGSPNPNIVPNTMYPVLVTRDNGVEKLYLNNFLLGTTNRGVTYKKGDRFNLGRYRNDFDVFDFKFYERVLTPTEITDIFNSGGVISPVGATCNVPFTESFGSNFNDISNNPLNLDFIIPNTFDQSLVALGVNNHHIDINSNPIL